MVLGFLVSILALFFVDCRVCDIEVGVACKICVETLGVEGCVDILVSLDSLRLLKGLILDFVGNVWGKPLVDGRLEVFLEGLSGVGDSGGWKFLGVVGLNLDGDFGLPLFGFLWVSLFVLGTVGFATRVLLFHDEIEKRAKSDIHIVLIVSCLFCFLSAFIYWGGILYNKNIIKTNYLVLLL